MKKTILILLMLFITTGCTATYNLEISENGFEESLTISATDISENKYIIDYPQNAYYDEIGNNEDPTKKAEGVEYYNSFIREKKDLKSINYNYLFNVENFERSNIIRNSFSTFVLKQYDHDKDGENDYMMISTTDDFNILKNNDELENLTININCHYEVISNNADKVDGNTYIWYLTPDNIKAINMVYNPEVIVDNRTIWEKIKDGEYTNIFTISIVLFLIGSIIYFIIKKRGDVKDKI